MLYQAVAEKLNWHALYTVSPRETNIISHYQREIDRCHMDRITALDRAIGDIQGRNYHPKLEQRPFQ